MSLFSRPTMERPPQNTRKRLALVPLPDVSPTELVRVLVAMGWVPMTWDEDQCIFERGIFRIRVPLEERLEGAALASLLQGAGIPALEFIDHLEGIRAQGMSSYAEQLRHGKSA